jgi:hypothetical protein
MLNPDFDFDNIISPIVGVGLAAAVYFYVRHLRRTREHHRAQAIAAGRPAPPVERRLPWIRGFIGAATLAAFYLVAFRGLSFLPAYYMDGKGGTILMSFSFLFLGPFIAGVITVSQAVRREPWPVKFWIVAPWIPILVNIILALSVRWEGLICVVFIAPPAMLSASLGGAAAGYLQRYEHHRVTRTTLSCLAVLPLFFAVLEAHLNQPLQIRSVDTEIRIHAPASVVWQNIGRVPPIRRSELRLSWANMIGFPRPIEATMSYEGVGAVRHGIFERGLTFDETVTAWDPGHRYAFTIRADTAHIPSTTLDEHVTVGGRFFDLLDGEYIVEPLPDGDVLLHLNSRERLSTDFNLYAAMWSDAVMHDVQNNILYVVQHRCESQASATKLLH